jgi:uncharacterized protein YjaG (DUF416 family)
VHWHWNDTVGVLLVPVYLGFTIRAAMLSFETVNKLNAVLPKAEQFALLGWYPDKHRRFAQSYRMHFPGEGSRRRSYLYAFAGVASFVLMVAAFVG